MSKAKCCIITPRGEGGIGVISLYGEGSSNVLKNVFHGTKKKTENITPGTIAHGRIVQDGQTVDEVLVARITCEQGLLGIESYEINCHGGAVAVTSVVECLCENGAELTSWQQVVSGEQVKHDPLSPDSIRKAALAKLPDAETRPAALMLLAQLNGALNREMKSVQGLLDSNKITEAEARVAVLLDTASEAIAMLKPAKVMLLGPPNAGKSTLLNTLLRQERVIVHPTPGTTRDVVKDRVAVKGVPFDLMDTAGVHEGQDELESVAIRKTLKFIDEADVLFFIFDVHNPNIRPLYKKISHRIPQKRVLFLANKSDLTGNQPIPLPDELNSEHVVEVSAKGKTGIEQLENFLLAPYAEVLERIVTGAPLLFTPCQYESLHQLTVEYRLSV